MKTFYFLLMFTSLLFASLDDDLSTINSMYKNADYKKACRFGANKILKYRESETFVSIFAFSCVEADQIDKSASAAVLLKQSPKARANALYFSTLLLQKKILLHAMFDDFKISSLTLPSTNHILSKVFDLYMQYRYNNGTKLDLYKFTDKNNPNESYEMYKTTESGDQKVVIKHYLNNKLLNTHKYW